VLLVLAGAVTVAGIFYAVHLAARKAHELSRQVRDGGIIASLPTDDDDTGTAGPITGPGACRLLSKEEVGRAIGIAIVATRTTASGCEYLAQGTAGEMTAKHVAAMMAKSGASDQQQQMMQSLSRGLLGAGQADGSSPNPDVNSVVMSFAIKPNASQFKMEGNENALSGIGDQAIAVAGSVLVVRKGSKLIRITYSSCPCTTTAIIPLAKRLAASQ
jgi:hypothetical protein